MLLVRPDKSLALIPEEKALALNTPACRTRCCGPGQPRGWTSLVRCDTTCDDAFPITLFLPEGRCSTGLAYVWYQSVCYRCTGERLWDCQNFGQAPPGYECAPFSFYLPGTRIEQIGPGGVRPTCTVDECALCVPDGSVVVLPPCLGCQRLVNEDCDGDPLPNPPDGIDRTPYFRYSDVIAALTQVPGVLNRRCAAIRSGLCCFRVDLLLPPPPHPGIPDPNPPANLRSVDGVHEACCDCSPTLGDLCKWLIPANVHPPGPSISVIPNCEAGARRDEFRRYLCPFEEPTNLRCCCPGLVTGTYSDPPGGPADDELGDPRNYRVLRFRAVRVEINGGVTTTTTFAGGNPGDYATIPGIVGIFIDGVARNSIRFDLIPPCDPFFGLSGVVGFIPCGDPDYTTEATGDCRNAHFVGRLIRPDYTNVLTYDATLGPRQEPEPFWGESAWFACNDGCGGDNPAYWPPGEGGVPPGGRPAPTAGGLLDALLGAS